MSETSAYLWKRAAVTVIVCLVVYCVLGNARQTITSTVQAIKVSLGQTESH